jgi:hypothetical protein
MRKAKDIGSLTDFLVSNPLFRQFALGIHNGKKDLMKNAEQYLDKELLGKEAPKKPLNLNTKGRNTASSNHKYTSHKN